MFIDTHSMKSPWTGRDRHRKEVNFLSKVCKLIVFQKMPLVRFVLPRAGPIMCSCDDNFEKGDWNENSGDEASFENTN